MKAYETQGAGIQALTLVDKPAPAPCSFGFTQIR